MGIPTSCFRRQQRCPLVVCRPKIVGKKVSPSPRESAVAAFAAANHSAADSPLGGDQQPKNGFPQRRPHRTPNGAVEMSSQPSPVPPPPPHASAAPAAMHSLHRRSSSRWIPPTAPIYERALDLTAGSLRDRLFRRKKDRTQDRNVEPNWIDTNIPRYRLPNYKHYASNKISTSKYTWWNFVPKNLWEQFHRWANIYFCMNWIPALQAFSRYLGMIPVIVILSTTAIKDFIEDWRRKRADRRLNHNTVHVWDPIKKRFRKTLWESVLVGDLIHVSLDEKLPADMVLLRSSDPQGCVFVETANLDGENNLKQKTVVQSCKRLCLSDTFDPSTLYARVVCNPPDNRMNHISGSVIYKSGETDKISKENVILRGCLIRNTAFAEGIVIYTGKETKLMLSNGSVKYKRSSLEQITNYFILFCVALLIFMVVSGGICSMFWLKDYDVHHKNIPFAVLFTSSPISDGFINMAAYVLVYQTLIPLSLYISIEMIKLWQNYLMTQDIDMYDPERDKKLLCRSLNIPEELGQIRYVLSDKTGTLTENKMVFRSCAIMGEIYENEGARRRSTLRATNAAPLLDRAIDAQKPHIVHQRDEDTPQISNRLKNLLISGVNSNTRSSQFFFLLTMGVCNTVMVRRKQQLDDVEMGYVEDNVYNVGNSAFFVPIDESQTPTRTNTPKLSEQLTPSSALRQFSFAPSEFVKRFGSLSSLSKIFQKKPQENIAAATATDSTLYDAESPDELALVKAADAYGFTLSSRSASDIRLRLPTTAAPFNDTIYEDEIELEILKILPFDSDRKRMSILVKFEDRILLLCKGADEQIIPNLDPHENSPELIEKTKRILENYGRVGLRTLCLAMREVDEEEFVDWLDTRELVEAACNEETDELVMESSKRIETNMRLLGVTAIEDRLQPGVTETIESLRAAGLQVWVLTGDKCETAINIARSCHLFNSHLETIIFKSLEDVLRWPRGTLLFNAVFSSEVIKLMREGTNEEIFEMIPHCAAIVCYRMTPAEKADVVKAVKTRLNGKTLAIGDGANDVPMILSADVGVGISGREGLQAVMASDFAISRFRFLKKLLLVHGHWNYYRLSNAILYFLDKNAVFVLVIFWQQLFNGFSSGFFIDPIYSMLYPIIFTSVQPIVYSIFDQDVEKELLLKNPDLYEQGRESELCTFRLFALNMLDAFWQSAAIFFVPFLCYQDSTATCWQLAFVISTALFFTNTLHLALLVRLWTMPFAIINAIFICIHFLFFFVYTGTASVSLGTKDPPLRVAYTMTAEFQFWSCCVLTVVMGIMPRVICRLLNHQFFPDRCHQTKLREKRKQNSAAA